jgi:hypothetical protein
MDPLTALTAFAPVLVEAAKAAVSRWIAPEQFRPASIEQWALMQDKQIALFQALNSAGAGGVSYPWVEAIVRLQRPLVAALVLLVWGWSRTVGTPSEAVDNAAAAVAFYLFGDRTLFYSRRAVLK